MTAAQIAFASALAVVLVGSVGAAVSVVASSRRGQRLGDHGEVGRTAYLVHRISGLAIFAFLALHVVDIALDGVSHRLYDEIQKLYGTAPVRVFECALLFAVLFHTFNGLRLVALDVAPGASWPRHLVFPVLALVVVGGAAGSAVILAPVVA